MKALRTSAALLAAAVVLSACGGGGGEPGNRGTASTSTTRGTLLQNPPPRLVGLTATDLQASLNATASGQGLLAVAGAPTCGVDVQYFSYATVGAAGEATTATGALMTPNGNNAKCSGPRPLLLYAHGTTTDKGYNLAALTDPTNGAYSEAGLLAAMWVGQGYIVVAPNYAGYDASTLSYHPYLIADQQSKDMMDALAAARTALPGLLGGVSDNGKLFVSGYSEGGHVAMATHRAIEAAGGKVTASTPMSGPYAMASFADAVFYGNVNLGSTIFTPLLTNSYQKAYGNLYTTPSDIYEAPYASGIDTLLPSTSSMTTLFTAGKLPQTALFNSTPPTAPAGSPAIVQATLNAVTPPKTGAATDALFAAGFGTSNLLKNSLRLAYLLDAMNNPDGVVPAATTGMPATAPAHPMRIAGKKNDLRNWTPKAPVLLCGGNGDPTVFWQVNTLVMKSFWTAPSPYAPAAGMVTVLDVDSAASGASDPFAAAKAGFAQAKAATAAAAGANGATAVIQAYHGSLVPPFCNAAARGFLAQF